jgi:hypothetical protein
MKTMELSDASKPLSDYAEALDDDILVLTSKKKPLAALVPFEACGSRGVPIQSLGPLSRQPGTNSGLARGYRLRR